MCTICGVASLKPEPSNAATVIDMLHRTRHRGPDGCGLHAARRTEFASSPEELRSRDVRPAHIVLGQSRLRITGTRAGRQPFVSDDGALALAHNGEVYNHSELAALVGDPGQTATGSDSEVLFRVLEHHYRAVGGDLTEAMRRTVAVASGMYALAAVDDHGVVLARDAIGKKPLYFVHGRTRFGFASERKALGALAAEQEASIERVPPGHMVVHVPGRPLHREVVERLAPPAIDVSDGETAIRVYHEALDLAIARRTRGLRRAAVLFSGGVDSVLVARLLQRAGLEVTGYVAGVEGSGDITHAVQVAKELNLPIKVHVADEATVERDLPRILEATELHGPVQTEVSIPMWYASRAAHEDGHRVIFTGQAADELFAGYAWYGAVLEEHGPLTLHARMWEDIRALPLDTLEREDRITMAWSLELRAPFLDADVIRAAMRITPPIKIRDAQDRQRKHPHRELALRLGVPRSVAYREKAMAQDGANTHELLARLARRLVPAGAPDGHVVPDFGSNYRYRDTPGAYTVPEVYTMLGALVARHGLVVARADGTAGVPPGEVSARAPNGAVGSPGGLVPTAAR